MSTPENGPHRPPREDEVVDELVDLLSVMRRQSAGADKALRRVETSRFNLLVVHAVAALLVSWLFMASAPALVGPVWMALNKIPGFPYSFGSVLCVGGLLLLPGAIARHRVLEFTGLTLIYLWYLAVGVGFFIPTALWLWEAVPRWYNDQSLPPDRPGFYAWVVYFHLAIIMRVHMWTLRRLRKQERLSQMPPPEGGRG